jgi:hypothetical protein
MLAFLSHGLTRAWLCGACSNCFISLGCLLLKYRGRHALNSYWDLAITEMLLFSI